MTVSVVPAGHAGQGEGDAPASSGIGAPDEGAGRAGPTHGVRDRVGPTAGHPGLAGDQLQPPVEVRRQQRPEDQVLRGRIQPCREGRGGRLQVGGGGQRTAPGARTPRRPAAPPTAPRWGRAAAPASRLVVDPGAIEVHAHAVPGQVPSAELYPDAGDALDRDRHPRLVGAALAGVGHGASGIGDDERGAAALVGGQGQHEGGRALGQVPVLGDGSPCRTGPAFRGALREPPALPVGTAGHEDERRLRQGSKTRRTAA